MQQQLKNKPAGVVYPRTGKRGVPQQFPRRLYEMLERESSSSATSNTPPLIAWSPSGRAFHILDANLFAETVLPTYFRTAKFSSFQRNLNLYGFSKVKNGPDADMYAHPSFVRGHPENLFLLRKLTAAADRRRAAEKLEQRMKERQEKDAAEAAAAVNPAAATNPTTSVFVAPPSAIPPLSGPLLQRMVSSSSLPGVVTDYSSSCQSSATSVCSYDASAVEIAQSKYNVSIPKLIKTYQKSVEAETAGLSNSDTDANATRQRNASTDSCKAGNDKLALLAMAMTSIAGVETS